jgi:hypothetical protein
VVLEFFRLLKPTKKFFIFSKKKEVGNEINIGLDKKKVTEPKN